MRDGLDGIPDARGRVADAAHRGERADHHGGDRHRHGDAERAANTRRPLGANAPLDAADELIARPRSCRAQIALEPIAPFEEPTHEMPPSLESRWIVPCR